MNKVRSGNDRYGLTLLEIIIVLAILITVAALAVPSVSRSFSAQKLIKAADRVRTELNRARVRAMRSGEIHAFFYQVETANFKVAAFNNEITRLLNESFQRRQEGRPTNFDFGGGTLPRGILFADGEAIEDARSEFALSENPSASNLQPILFYPDGSSQSARIYIRSEDSDVAEIRLRGMTGTSTSSIVDVVR